jgi:hypothetical protein
MTYTDTTLTDYTKAKDQNDALGTITGNFTALGLPASLASWAWGEIQAGKSEAQIMIDLEGTDAFKQRFPAIGTLRARASTGENVHVPTPGEYIQAETTYTSLMRTAGLPPGFYDSQADFTNLISNQVSPQELQSRIQEGYSQMVNAPADVKQQLNDYYGVTPGQLAAYFLDPKVGVDVIRKQVAAANIGAAATRSGYGGVTSGEAEGLFGVSAGQAETGFGTLAREKELFGALPGEQSQGVSRADQLATISAPTGQAAQTLDEIARRRKAQFGGGGDFTAGAGGVSGLGTAG